MLWRLLKSGRPSLCFRNLSKYLSGRGRFVEEAVVCARDIVEDACRNGTIGGEGSEYRSALEAALRRTWFLVIVMISGF